MNEIQILPAYILFLDFNQVDELLSLIISSCVNCFFAMASFSVIVCRVWDLYVTYSILTGWLLSRINTYNSSLLCAWIIFLCDLVYIMDALARTSKTSQSCSSWASFIVSESPGTILAKFITVFKFVTFVPYHVLVIVDLDVSGVYFLVCALRVVRLLQSGRLYVHVAWTLTNLAKNGGLLAQSVYHTKNRPQRKARKANRDEHLKRTVESSPFVMHVQKLVVQEMEGKS